MMAYWDITTFEQNVRNTRSETSCLPTHCMSNTFCYVIKSYANILVRAHTRMYHQGYSYMEWNKQILAIKGSSSNRPKFY